MSLKTLNQKAFTLVESLLILIAVVLIGFTGYYVWNSSRKDVPKKETASTYRQAKKETKANQPDESASWFLYEAPSGNFKLRLPDGWKLQRYQDSDGIYSANPNDIAYVKGTPATVTRVEGGRDFANIAFSVGYGESSLSYNKWPDAVEQTGLKTNQGLDVKKYTRTQTAVQEGLGPSQGTVTYQYFIFRGGNVLGVTHDIGPGETNQTALIEKALKTVELK